MAKPTSNLVRSATVGIRFHDISKLFLLERCVTSVCGQQGVRPCICVATQSLTASDLSLMRASLEPICDIASVGLCILNVDGNTGKDIRSRLLNQIIYYHYEQGISDLIAFIDYDDVWFGHALSVLASPFRSGPYALSYASVHAAHVKLLGSSILTVESSDLFGVSKKTKAFLARQNFLPLHSYMFNTSVIERGAFVYDESLTMLEDYDMLLRIASGCPVSSANRHVCIGLYNFYSGGSEDLNTCSNPFVRSSSNLSRSKASSDALHILLEKHGNLKWRSFFGEDLIAPDGFWR